jgi:hypothetical protein
MTQDAKKDEFRKYLEKAGVLELLTKSLVSVLEMINILAIMFFTILSPAVRGA